MTIGANFSYLHLAKELQSGNPIAQILNTNYKIFYSEDEFFIDTGKFINDLKEVKNHKSEFKITNIEWGQIEKLQLAKEAIGKIDKISRKILLNVDLTAEPNLQPIFEGLSDTFHLENIKKTYTNKISKHPHKEPIVELLARIIEPTYTLLERRSLLFLLADLPQGIEGIFNLSLNVYADVLDTYKNDRAKLADSLLNIEATDRIGLLDSTEELRSHYSNGHAYGAVLEILSKLPFYGWTHYAKVLKKIVPQESEEFRAIVFVFNQELPVDIFTLLDDLNECSDLPWDTERATILSMLRVTPRQARTPDFICSTINFMNMLTPQMQRETLLHYETLPDDQKVKLFEDKAVRDVLDEVPPEDLTPEVSKAVRTVFAAADPELKAKIMSEFHSLSYNLIAPYFLEMAKRVFVNYYEKAMLLFPAEERTAELSCMLIDHLDKIGQDKHAAFVAELEQIPEEIRGGYLVSLMPQEELLEPLQPIYNKINTAKARADLTNYFKGSQEDLPKLMEAVAPLLDQMKSHFLSFFKALVAVPKQKRKLLCRNIAQNIVLKEFTDGIELARILTSLSEIPKECRKSFLKRCTNVMQNLENDEEKLELFCLFCLLPPRSKTRVFTATHNLFKSVAKSFYHQMGIVVKSVPLEERDLAVCQLAQLKERIHDLQHLKLMLELYINIPNHLRSDEVMSYLPAITAPFDYSDQLLMCFSLNEKCTVEELLSEIINIIKGNP